MLAADHERVICSDCGWTGTAEDTDEISHFEERVAPGEICPAGECKRCGALAHLVEDEQTEDTPPDARNTVRVARALDHLRQARNLLKLAGAPRAVDKVRAALKSTEGAQRHARNHADA